MEIAAAQEEKEAKNHDGVKSFQNEKMYFRLIFVIINLRLRRRGFLRFEPFYFWVALR
ncbi:hypothetical protein ACX8WC_16490 [Bacillus atrophaeus]